MRKFLMAFGTVLLLMLCVAGLCGAEAEKANPSTVDQTSGLDGSQLFTNGTIYIDADNKAYNLLVKDGKVTGWNVEPERHASAAIVDMKGAVAYPGFIDSHCHLMEAGTVLKVGANLADCRDVDSIVNKLAEKIKSIPEDGVVMGIGYSLGDYDKWSLEDLAKLDEVTGNRPAFLVDQLGHNAIINTATMKLVDLTPGAPIPQGGMIIKENGRLTGMLRERAMSIPWPRIFARFSTEDIMAGTLAMLGHWASIGYSGAIDMMGAPGLRFMRPDIFMEMEKQGILPLRVHYCYTIFDLNDVPEAAKYVGNDTELVRFLGCKIFIDGACAGGEAWTSWTNKLGGHGFPEIYTDDSHGEQLNLNRIVAKVEEHGMNMHYHVQGDMAIGAVLDALDKVREEKGRINGVHTLVHLAFPTNEQVERIKKFDGNVVTTVQPGFWAAETDGARYYGEQAIHEYPISKLIESGVSVGMSTDFSVSPIQYAPASVVLGVAATGAGNPRDHLPLKVRDVVNGFTVGSARTTGKNDMGKLDVGYKADLVVYEKDLYSVDPEKFSRDYPKLISTWVGGRKTHEQTVK